MEVTNTRIHTNLSMGQYLALPGVSHSWIKNGGVSILATSKMSLGTSVHNYLSEPGLYNHESVQVKKIAAALKERLGLVWKFLKHEIVVTADFSFEGLTLPFKGRIDAGIPGKMIIDYKIINGTSIKNTLFHFGYPNQLSGYARALGAPVALIIAINSKTLKEEIINIPIQDDWWDKQILKYGR